MRLVLIWALAVILVIPDIFPAFAQRSGKTNCPAFDADLIDECFRAWAESDYLTEIGKVGESKKPTEKMHRNECKNGNIQHENRVLNVLVVRIYARETENYITAPRMVPVVTDVQEFLIYVSYPEVRMVAWAFQDRLANGNRLFPESISKRCTVQWAGPRRDGSRDGAFSPWEKAIEKSCKREVTRSQTWRRFCSAPDN